MAKSKQPEDARFTEWWNTTMRGAMQGSRYLARKAWDAGRRQEMNEWVLACREDEERRSHERGT